MSQEQMSRGIEMIESAAEKIRQETTSREPRGETPYRKPRSIVSSEGCGVADLKQEFSALAEA
jgi:hypothetical protein